MSDKDRAIEILAERVIMYQNMVNVLQGEIEMYVGESRLKVKIDDKQALIDSALGKNRDDE